MAFTTYFTRIGAAKVQLPVKLPNTYLPSLSTLSATSWSVTRSQPSALTLNDINSPLDTTASYYFMVAPLGADMTNGGLTISQGSSTIGPVSIANVQTDAFLVNIPASNFPNNLTNAYALGVWMRKNSSNYALQGYYVVDPNGNDFNAWITCEPLVSQTLYPIATLQSSTADTVNYPELGDRLPRGCSFSSSLRTTGGVEVGRNVDTVEVNPDNSPKYPQPTSRGTALRFSILSNTMQNVVLANAGKYAKGAVPGGHTVQTATMSLQTAVAFTTGNVPFKLIMPPDGNRVSEVRYYLASVQVNLTGANEHWRKDGTTPLQFQVNTVNLDPLLNDVDVELQYSFQT